MLLLLVVRVVLYKNKPLRGAKTNASLFEKSLAKALFLPSPGGISKTVFWRLFKGLARPLSQ